MWIKTIKDQRVYINPAFVESIRSRSNGGSTIEMNSGREYATNFPATQVMSVLGLPSLGEVK